MERLEVPKNFDLLVVDVEGKESEIFQTFELNEWKPKMIIVELEDEILQLLNEAKPELILEDVKLIDTLNFAKETSNNVKEIL